MASVRKFTFDLRFDDPETGVTMPMGTPQPERVIAAPPPPPPPPEPEPEIPAGPPLIYTEEDMEIAREEAYVAGHMRALEEAQAATEQATATALMTCRDALEKLPPVLTNSNAQIADLAAQVAAEICRKLLPHTSEEYAVGEISALVRSLMPSLTDQPRLLVRVHPDLINTLREPLTNIAYKAGFEGKVVVLEGENMELSDARVEWPDGGAERNTTRLWDEIDALIARNIPHFTRNEALEIPSEDQPDAASLSQEATPWPDLEHEGWWTPPSPHDDLQASPLPPFSSAPGSEPSAAEMMSPFGDMGFGDPTGDDFDDGFVDLDGDLALTPEQEAELAALDAQLSSQKSAAIDGEPS